MIVQHENGEFESAPHDDKKNAKNARQFNGIGPVKTSLRQRVKKHYNPNPIYEGLHMVIEYELVPKRVAHIIQFDKKSGKYIEYDTTDFQDQFEDKDKTIANLKEMVAMMAKLANNNPNVMPMPLVPDNITPTPLPDGGFIFTTNPQPMVWGDGPIDNTKLTVMNGTSTVVGKADFPEDDNIPF